MAKNLTKIEFIQAITETDGRLTQRELAEKLHVSPATINRMYARHRSDIKDAALELTRQLAIRNIHNLQSNADNGDTQAAKLLLEMAQLYAPASTRLQLDMPEGAAAGVIYYPSRVPIGAPVVVDPALEIEAQDGNGNGHNGNGAH